MKESLLYNFLRPFIKVFTYVFIHPIYEGLDNIPKNGRVVLAGVHTSIFDCLVLISASKRGIHFLAKKELFEGVKGVLFSNLGLIPVDRSRKDGSVLVIAQKYLESEMVVGIFPEGTTQKGRGLLPFKIGAVKMAFNTNTKIVPFVIKGKYGLFNRVRVKFGSMFEVSSDDLDYENGKLRDVIIKMLEEE